MRIHKHMSLQLHKKLCSGGPSYCRVDRIVVQDNLMYSYSLKYFQGRAGMHKDGDVVRQKKKDGIIGEKTRRLYQENWAPSCGRSSPHRGWAIIAPPRAGNHRPTEGGQRSPHRLRGRALIARPRWGDDRPIQARDAIIAPCWAVFLFVNSTKRRN